MISFQQIKRHVTQKNILGRSLFWIKENPTSILAYLLIAGWVSAYFTTGSKIEWGDFSFFAQGYEAMRISIFEYGQFPWYNSWVSGGVPLYANPQFGLFSIQTLLVFIFGSITGLKIAIILYTILGFLSMRLLLERYFKIAKNSSVLISLLWIFGTFFVGHLPAHFTFVWFMLAPFFAYLALTIKDWKGGILLGASFGVMALSQTHNPFIHIAFISGIILAVRLIRSRFSKEMLISLGVAAGAFLVIAGHRIFYTYQNIKQFPREVSDMVPDFYSASIAPFLPMSQNNPLTFIKHPQHPLIPHNFNEATAYIGAGLYIVAIIGILYLVYNFVVKKSSIRKNKTAMYALIALGVALLCYLTALGDFDRLSPYNFLKHLPVFSEMRVSTRWFLWFNLALLIFVALVVKLNKGKTFVNFALHAFIAFAVMELFALNFQYQKTILIHTPVLSDKSTKERPFAQTAYFGEERKLPNGDVIPDDGSMPDSYREFEAMSFNLGVLYANDALVQLHLDSNYRPGHPTCPFEEGCSLVRSNNATVSYWSPNKIVLKRTAPGNIYLNMNNSSYFVINGQRNDDIRVSEPLNDFVITDTSDTITIESNPSMMNTIIRKIKNQPLG